MSVHVGSLMRLPLSLFFSPLIELVLSLKNSKVNNLAWCARQDLVFGSALCMVP